MNPISGNAKRGDGSPLSDEMQSILRWIASFSRRPKLKDGTKRVLLYARWVIVKKLLRRQLCFIPARG